MTSLDTYLAGNFLNAEKFAASCGISVDELDDLIQKRLIPAPSYTVTELLKVCSFVFGEMEAEGSTPGRYFHPANAVWVGPAREMVATYGEQVAKEELKKEFGQNFQEALKDLNTTTMRLRDCFNDDGSWIVEGLEARINLVWEHYLQGTFGLCVANPISEAAIARKEVLQEKLNKLSDKGSRTEYSLSEAQEVLNLVDAFADSSMPFSPIEYHLSSRKHLVDDIRNLLRADRQ